MDPEAFLDLANQVIKLKMYPYFDIAHSLLCALAVREDLGAGKWYLSFSNDTRQFSTVIWFLHALICVKSSLDVIDFDMY